MQVGLKLNVWPFQPMHPFSRHSQWRDMIAILSTGFSTFTSLPLLLFLSSFFCYMANYILRPTEVSPPMRQCHAVRTTKHLDTVIPPMQQWSYRLFVYAYISSLLCRMVNTPHPPPIFLSCLRWRICRILQIFSTSHPPYYHDLWRSWYIGDRTVGPLESRKV